MNDSIRKTLGVAFAICLICSFVVSSTAVSLRDMQNENKANDKRMKILQAAGIFDPSKDIKEQFSTLEPKYIDFNTGKLLTGSSLDEFLSEHKGDYDQIAATRNSKYSKSLSTSEDIAIIKNRENIGKFYLLRNDDYSINKVILPVRGYGLWGTFLDISLLKMILIQSLDLNFMNIKRLQDWELKLIIQNGRHYGLANSFIKMMM